jgi:hypothetical protein
MRIGRLCLSLLAVAGSVFGADPFVGTWKLKIAQSKLPAGMTDIQEDILRVDVVGPKTYRLTDDLTRTNGRKSHVVNTLVVDGKDHPGAARNTGKEVPNSIMNFQRPDERHIKASFRMNGKEFQTMETTVTPDGGTLISVRRGSAPNSQNLDETDVYQRQ